MQDDQISTNGGEGKRENPWVMETVIPEGWEAREGRMGVEVEGERERGVGPMLCLHIMVGS